MYSIQKQVSVFPNKINQEKAHSKDRNNGKKIGMFRSTIAELIMLKYRNKKNFDLEWVYDTSEILLLSNKQWPLDKH